MLSAETANRLAAQGASEATLIDALKMVFPNGHEDYLPQCVAEMELHSVKNHDYASGGSPLGNFERVASILALYPGLKLSDPKVIALLYALKQVDAVLWGLAQNITHKVEGIISRLDDVAVYAKIVKCIAIEERRNAEIEQCGPYPLPQARQSEGLGGSYTAYTEFNQTRSASDTPFERAARGEALGSLGGSDCGGGKSDPTAKASTRDGSSYQPYPNYKSRQG